MTSLFTKIINRKIPAHIIYEDSDHIVFLDIRPINEGHLLVVPKKETDYLFDMNEKEYLELMKLAKKIAPSLKEATQAKRIGMFVEGFGVPHVHIHLVPIDRINQLNPELAHEVPQETLKIIAARIRERL